MNELLEQIKKENDIYNISPEDYPALAREIRHFIVRSLSRTGGHLASNLGVVELTMALHLCCHLPEDKIVWDVGHQCYTHKILTGRKDGFQHLRTYGGMSGFPRRRESPCDVLDTGHSSTSVGAALGLARARDLRGEHHKIFAVIGDGALSGGMAFEALNNAARLRSNMVIVLNDNQMSISKNVGGLSNYLGKIRTNNNYTGLKEDVERVLQKMPHIGSALTDHIRSVKDVLKRILIPGMLFEDMGITYIGPINGHDIHQMTTAFHSALKSNRAVIVHVVTQKGKGYPPAQKDPSSYHGVAPFFIRDGRERRQGERKLTYTQVFSQEMLQLGEEREDIAAISAAMPSGTGLTGFAGRFPERFFDVGIAEEHAVTFAAGMAAGGIRPVVALYSTFLQRAYDQILHDVCINRLPVVFAVDRAGLVGSDGKTHQGIFDLSFLLPMPGMTVMAPKNVWELRKMLRYAVDLGSPVAVRYPRGTAWQGLEDFQAPIVLGESEWIYREGQVALFALGSMVETAVEVREILKEKGYQVSLINARFAKPLDEKCLAQAAESHQLIVPMEEGVITGGFCQSVADWCCGREGIEVCPVALPDAFIEHGSVAELKRKYQLDAAGIAEKIEGRMNCLKPCGAGQEEPLEQVRHRTAAAGEGTE